MTGHYLSFKLHVVASHQTAVKTDRCDDVIAHICLLLLLAALHKLVSSVNG